MADSSMTQRSQSKKEAEVTEEDLQSVRQPGGLCVALWHIHLKRLHKLLGSWVLYKDAGLFC